jgi:hypothetical protein
MQAKRADPNGAASAKPAAGGKIRCFEVSDGWIETKLTSGASDARLTLGGIVGSQVWALASRSRVRPPDLWLFDRSGSTWPRTRVLPLPAPLSIISVDVDAAAFLDWERRLAHVYHIREGALVESGRLQVVLPLDYPSLVLRGDRLVVADSDLAEGWIAVHARSGSTWRNVQRIVQGTGGRVGYGLAFDGNRIASAVGGVASIPEPDGISIYGERNGRWHEEAWLPAEAIHPGAPITAVAIDGDYLAAGGPFQGVVVFERGETGWRPVFRHSLGAAPGLHQLDLKGNRMIAGAFERAELFERKNGRWQHTQTLTPGDELGQGFGASVAMGPATLVVTAPQDSTWGERQPGAVYVYEHAPDVAHEPRCITEVSRGGEGTTCSRSGVMRAECPAIRSGFGAVSGKTPFGPIDLRHAWLHVQLVYGGRSYDSDRTEVAVHFGAASPDRPDARPRLHVRVVGARNLAGAQIVPAVLELCDRSVPIRAHMSIDEIGDVSWDGIVEPPVRGSIRIAEPGWDVTGTFDLVDLCGWDEKYPLGAQ